FFQAEDGIRDRTVTGVQTCALPIFWMPDADGITLLKEWATGGQLTMPVIMMSGHGTIDTAVEATRIGAMDFLEKPIALQKLLARSEERRVGKEGRSRVRAEAGNRSI